MIITGGVNFNIFLWYVKFFLPKSPFYVRKAFIISKFGGDIMHSVKQIIKENWKSYLRAYNPTNHQRWEIIKMMDCSKNSCNSRICSSCGKRYNDVWSNNLVKRLYPFPCRHVVLTVPSLLRPVLRNWRNLNILIRSSMDFFNSFT